MKIIIDILNMALTGLQKLSIREFYLTIFGAVIFSIITGLICHYLYKLWNKHFTTTFTHKLLSVISCILSFLFIISYVGFSFLEEVAISKITLWEEQLKLDGNFNQQAFLKAFRNVKQLGVEDFSNVLPPEQGGNSFPTSDSKSQLEAGKTYYEEAIQNFQKKNKFLNAILSVKSNNTPEQIQEDMQRFFAQGNDSYNAKDGIEIAANNLKSSLFKQAPKVVKISRMCLVVLFIIVQLLPFSWISYLAYKDLKIQA